jgi:hypothetical protein
MPQPAHPKIYYIVHIDRLPSIINDGRLLCDAVMMQSVGGGTTIGMTGIKRRRLTLPVTCHQGTQVGDYVPFYFCPRSVMLFVIDRANHPDLVYRGGQEPIVHLEADLHHVLAWADSNRRLWAFALSNAGAVYTKFRSSRRDLGAINWDAVAARDFRPADVKEGKQAEFLIHQSFPWALVERVGSISQIIGQQVVRALRRADHRPVVEIRREWYY